MPFPIILLPNKKAALEDELLAPHGIEFPIILLPNKKAANLDLTIPAAIISRFQSFYFLIRKQPLYSELVSALSSGFQSFYFLIRKQPDKAIATDDQVEAVSNHSTS